jgi:hypothetical protein
MITIPAISLVLLVLLAVLLGAVLTLAGAALGGLFVFRTKREPHESLFKLGQEQGDAFVQDDIGEDGVAILERLAARRREKEPQIDESGLDERFARMQDDFAKSHVGKANAKFVEQQGSPVPE